MTARPATFMVSPMRGWAGWVVAGLVLWVATTSGAANSDVRACRQSCQLDFQDAVTEPTECFNCPGCDDCDGQLADAVDGLDSCFGCINGDCGTPAFFSTCTGQCASPKTFVCALNLTCARKCRAERDALRQVCQNRFRKQVRAVCRQVACGADVNYFATARRVRRQCERACKTEGGAASSALKPPAETPEIATAPAEPQQSSGLPPGCSCQRQCIRGIVGGCFDACITACKGDLDALALCNRACRNAQCASLRANCTMDSEKATSYLACCEQCASSGACDDDRDAESLCTPTTSTTTTTTTSTTSTSTGPTTTTFAGQTTSTSTTSTTTIF